MDDVVGMHRSLNGLLRLLSKFCDLTRVDTGCRSSVGFFY